MKTYTTRYIKRINNPTLEAKELAAFRTIIEYKTSTANTALWDWKAHTYRDNKVKDDADWTAPTHVPTTVPVPIRYMSTLASLKSILRTSIHTAKVLLGTATTPVQNRAQEFVHSEYIEIINDLTFKATTSLLEIEAKHRNDIDATELATFRTSLTNIEHKTSTDYTALPLRWTSVPSTPWLSPLPWPASCPPLSRPPPEPPPCQAL